MKSHVGWWLAGGALLYFALSGRKPDSTQTAVRQVDPLGGAGDPPADSWVSPVSAVPWSYGAQMGNSSRPVMPAPPFGGFAARTQTYYRPEVPEGGDPINPYSSDATRYGSSY